MLGVGISLLTNRRSRQPLIFQPKNGFEVPFLRHHRVDPNREGNLYSRNRTNVSRTCLRQWSCTSRTSVPFFSTTKVQSNSHNDPSQRANKQNPRRQGDTASPRARENRKTMSRAHSVGAPSLTARSPQSRNRVVVI